MSFMKFWIGRSRTVLIVALGFALCIGAPVRAQSSIPVRVQWDPNPVSDGITQYSLTVDGGAPLIVLPSVCTASLCEQALTVAPGSHTFIVSATNQWGTTPTTVTAVIAPPVPPKNVRIVK